MQINIPADSEAFVVGKAAAAGFTDVNEYVIRLIERDGGGRKPAPALAFEKLRRLRSEVPKMTNEEIVDLVAEGRRRCLP
ncbi:hypothetical protein [Lacipirellula limnantheis]|uniref:Uncharacterized protein n=1 Tax=Lacipirellula limnantheis TaxID=2528024 RepID=A0A517U6C6_9BACT|nr:hypothetical protein [Lacipirellula limnantheis]QDT76153.1 hypothetical protein I41_53980 [Lacipirellula limnantheis]